MKLTKRLTSQLGRDADKPDDDSDFAFYDWLRGTAERPTLLELLIWLIDDLKHETDPEEVRKILDLWKRHCDAAELKDRMTLLQKMMPRGHPFHKLKKKFEK